MTHCGTQNMETERLLLRRFLIDDADAMYTNWASDTDTVQIGYCLGRAWWHRGIMSEALKAVMDFFFDEVGANRIESRHDSRNPHSGMVMKKCGMKYEGTLRSSDKNNQGICDACWYALLRAER